jgi:carbon monoxide dehydrogenase subunit G
LKPTRAATAILRYEVHAQVGGKIAQLGARLIDATAKQMAEPSSTGSPP